MIALGLSAVYCRLLMPWSAVGPDHPPWWPYSTRCLVHTRAQQSFSRTISPTFSITSFRRSALERDSLMTVGLPVIWQLLSVAAASVLHYWLTYTEKYWSSYLKKGSHEGFIWKNHCLADVSLSAAVRTVVCFLARKYKLSTAFHFFLWHEFIDNTVC